MSIVKTDKTFSRVEFRGGVVWEGKCIFCNKKVLLDENGRPISKVTIEHINPKHHGGTDDLENIALACASCNHEKGLRHDIKKPNRRSIEIIDKLLKKRLSRWRKDENLA